MRDQGEHEKPLPSLQDDANPSDLSRRNVLLGGTTLVAAVFGSGPQAEMAQAQSQPGPAAPAPGGKLNILVIYGDDIGITNISAYSDGLMGYETPSIDRIAREGIRFLYYY